MFRIHCTPPPQDYIENIHIYIYIRAFIPQQNYKVRINRRNILERLQNRSPRFYLRFFLSLKIISLKLYFQELF